MPNSNGLPTLAEVEADPRFAELPYARQVEVRNRWFQDMMQNGGLASEPAEVQQSVRNRLKTRPPVSMQQGQMTPFQQKIAALIPGVQQGDPQALDMALFEIAGANAAALTNVAKKIIGAVVRFSGNLGVDEEIIKQLDPERVWMNNPGDRDALEYLKQQMVLADPSLARRVGQAERRGKMAGFFTEFLTGRTIARGLGTVFSGTGARGTQLSRGIIQPAIQSQAKSFVGKWVFGSGLREAVESGGDAAFMTAAQVINDAVQDQIYEDLEGLERVGRMALNFGEFFVEDMVAFGLLSVGWKGLRSIGKVFTGGYGKAATQAMTDDQLRKAVSGLLGGEDIPEEWMANATEEQRRRFFRYRTRMKRAEMGVGELTTSDLEEGILAQHGFDLERLEDGDFRLWDLRKDAAKPRSLGTFVSTENAFLHAIDQSLEMQKSLGQRAGRGLQMVGTGDIELREVITAQGVPGTDLMRKQWASLLTPSLGRGAVDARKAEAVAKSMASDMGVPREAGTQIRVKSVGDYGRRIRQGQTRVGNTIYVPTSAPTRLTEERYVKRFLSDVKELAERRGGTDAGGWDVEGWFQTQYKKAQREEVGLSREWVRYKVETEMPGARIRQTGEGVSVVLPDGSSKTWASWGELGADLHLGTGDILDPEIVAQHLRRNFDLELRAPKAGQEGSHWTVRTRQGEILEQAADFGDLFRKNPKWLPKLPVEQAPDLIFDPTLDRLVYDKVRVRGPAEQLLELGRAYEKHVMTASERLLKEIKGSGTQVLLNDITHKFVVTSEELGVRKEFKSLPQALAWVNKSRKTFLDLEDVALEKGARIYPFRGQYVIHTIDDNRYVFKDLKSATAKLRDMPQLSGFEKELSGAEAEFIHTMQKEGLDIPSGAGRGIWNEYDLQKAFEDFGEQVEPKPRGRTYFGIGIRPPDAVFQTFAKDLGVPEFYSKFYEPMEKAITSYKGMSNKFDDLIESIFKDINARDAELLSELWEMPADQWAARADEMGLNFTGKHRRALEQSRILLSEELGRLFGVDNYKMLNQYLPHIRSWAHGAGKQADLRMKGGDLLKSILKTDHIPDDIYAFMQHFRTQDMLMLGTERNLKRVLRAYTHKGAKVLTMAEQHRRSVGWLNAHSEEIGSEALRYATEYLDDTMGLVTDSTRRGAERWSLIAGEKFYDFLQKRKIIPKSMKAKMQVQDFFSIMQGLTVASTMSFKGWMPIRNLHQPFTMLATRLGLGGGRVVLDAIGDMLKDGDAVAKHLRATGRLTSQVPIFGYRSQGLIGRWNKLGMTIYRNSDDANRILTDRVVNRLMKDASESWLRGAIDEKQFLDLSRIRVLDRGSQELIMTALKDKGYTIAKDIYGDILTRETQALYREGAGPAWFRNSQFGKFFGMFGQYPTYYLENLRRGMRNGTAADKAGFIAATTLYSAGLWGLYDQTLGISAQDFLPWGQMFHTGGPYYSLITDAMGAVSGAWDAPRADQLLKEAGRLFTPGSSAYRAIQDGVELWRNGDRSEAMLRFGSVPLAD